MEVLGRRLKTGAMVGLVLAFLLAIAVQRFAPDHVALVARLAGALGVMGGLGGVLSQEVVLSGRFGSEMRVVGPHAIAYGVTGMLAGVAVFLAPSAMTAMRAGPGAPPSVTVTLAGVAFGLAMTVGGSALFATYVGVFSKTPSLFVRAWGYITLTFGLGMIVLGGLLIAGVSVMTLFR